MAVTVQELAALVRGRLIGDGSVAIRAARPVGEAGPGDITFVDDERYTKALRASTAAAAIVGPHFRAPAPPGAPATTDGPALPMIEVDDPRAAFLAVRSLLTADARPRWSGIHAQAYVAPTATIGEGVAVYPFAYVGDDAVIGDGCTIRPGAVVGERCRLGRGVTIHPNAVLYSDVVLGDRVEIHGGTVLGADGFGYRQVDGRHVKIPQTGGLTVGDDVEVGANCTIDRGTFGPTTIGDGSKIDNLVMIGHNNKVGRHNLLCGQAGLAGSCRTGDHVVLAGQAGIKDHTTLGDRSVVGAQAGVHRDVPVGQQVLGSPALPIKEQRQLFVLTARLPELSRQVRDLAARVAALAAARPTIEPPVQDGA